MRMGTRETTDRRDIIRHDPAEGCRWRCITCGNYLRSRNDVRGHWALFSEGHSLFAKLSTSHIYHQTVEGLQRRGMMTAPPDDPPPSDDYDTALRPLKAAVG